MYLGSIESIDAMIPGSLQTVLHNISLLCTTIREPATCKGCQNCFDWKETGHEIFVPREKMETLRPVGPRWRKTYQISIAGDSQAVDYCKLTMSFGSYLDSTAILDALEEI